QPEKPAQIGAFDTPVQRPTSGVHSPHGGGGAGTGWVRSNSTRNRRPSSVSEPGGRGSAEARRASSVAGAPASTAQILVTDWSRPSALNRAMDSSSTGNS